VSNKLLSLIQTLVVAAAAAGVLSIVVVQFVNGNTERKEDEQVSLASREHNCRADFTRAESFIRHSPSLLKLVSEKVFNPRFDQPSAAAGFAPNDEYIWIRTKPDNLFPPNVIEPKNSFFKGLSESQSNFLKGLSFTSVDSPAPMVVRFKSIDMTNKQATVSSYCSNKSFSVDLKDLYGIFQTIDFE
jgi:hypothetical protein